jgi:hypothetical protein
MKRNARVQFVDEQNVVDPACGNDQRVGGIEAVRLDGEKIIPRDIFHAAQSSDAARSRGTSARAADW